jgi:hypothetical protein
MYAVRRLSGLGDDLDSKYFLAKLLDTYLDDPDTDTDDWDIVRDDRGTFTEPHTDRAVGMGTIAVRRYERAVRRFDPMVQDNIDPPEFSLSFPTVGPQARFGHILYIEKEGFDPLVESARIAERYDLAIVSCKGWSVYAARRLVRWLHDRYEVSVLVAHDFDKAGISIFDTLGDGYIDIGLRLDDIEDDRWNLGDDLASESVVYGKDGETDPRPNLDLRGAIEDEIEFLCPANEPPFEGRRVELNALVGQTFIDWLEAKLANKGVAKVVPDEDVMETAYRRADEIETLNVAIRRAADDARAAALDVEVPDDIVTLVTTGIEDDDTLPWDEVLAGVVANTIEENGEDR